MTVPVVIPTYRGEKRLQRVMECLAAQSVDTKPWLRDNNVNGVLYTKAVNEGLLSFCCDYPYILILCDDVYLEPDCLAALVRCAEEKPRAGIVSPVQVNKEGEIIWAGSLQSWPKGVHLLAKYDTKPYLNNWPSGACFLVRTEMVREIGVLDDHMRFICSDADYGLTARTRGWECWVAPDAEVEHTFNLSQNTEDIEMNRIKMQDLIYFTHKWITGGIFRGAEYEGERITVARAQAQIAEYEKYLEATK